jgi:hypothetical protein
MIFVYAVSCLLFALAFAGLRVWPLTRAISQLMRKSFAVVTDSQLSDEEKERALQKGSLELLRDAVKLAGALAATLACAALPAVLAELAGWISLEDFVAFSLRPVVLFATVAAFAALVRLARLMRQARQTA